MIKKTKNKNYVFNKNQKYFKFFIINSYYKNLWLRKKIIISLSNLDVLDKQTLFKLKNKKSLIKKKTLNLFKFNVKLSKKKLKYQQNILTSKILQLKNEHALFHFLKTNKKVNKKLNCKKFTVYNIFKGFIYDYIQFKHKIFKFLNLKRKVIKYKLYYLNYKSNNLTIFELLEIISLKNLFLKKDKVVNFINNVNFKLVKYFIQTFIIKCLTSFILKNVNLKSLFITLKISLNNVITNKLLNKSNIKNKISNLNKSIILSFFTFNIIKCNVIKSLSVQSFFLRYFNYHIYQIIWFNLYNKNDFNLKIDSLTKIKEQNKFLFVLKLLNNIQVRFNINKFISDVFLLKHSIINKNNFYFFIKSSLKYTIMSRCIIFNFNKNNIDDFLNTEPLMKIIKKEVKELEPNALIFNKEFKALSLSPTKNENNYGILSGNALKILLKQDKKVNNNKFRKKLGFDIDNLKYNLKLFLVGEVNPKQLPEGDTFQAYIARKKFLNKFDERTKLSRFIDIKTKTLYESFFKTIKCGYLINGSSIVCWISEMFFLLSEFYKGNSTKTHLLILFGFICNKKTNLKNLLLITLIIRQNLNSIQYRNKFIVERESPVVYNALEEVYYDKKGSASFLSTQIKDDNVDNQLYYLSVFTVKIIFEEVIQQETWMGGMVSGLKRNRTNWYRNEIYRLYRNVMYEIAKANCYQAFENCDFYYSISNASINYHNAFLKKTATYTFIQFMNMVLPLDSDYMILSFGMPNMDLNFFYKMYGIKNERQYRSKSKSNNFKRFRILRSFQYIFLKNIYIKERNVNDLLTNLNNKKNLYFFLTAVKQCGMSVISSIYLNQLLFYRTLTILQSIRSIHLEFVIFQNLESLGFFKNKSTRLFLYYLKFLLVSKTKANLYTYTCMKNVVIDEAAEKSEEVEETEGEVFSSTLQAFWGVKCNDRLSIKGNKFVKIFDYHRELSHVNSSLIFYSGRFLLNTYFIYKNPPGTGARSLCDKIMSRRSFAPRHHAIEAYRYKRQARFKKWRRHNSNSKFKRKRGFFRRKSRLKGYELKKVKERRLVALSNFKIWMNDYEKGLSEDKFFNKKSFVKNLKKKRKRMYLYVGGPNVILPIAVKRFGYGFKSDQRYQLAYTRLFADDHVRRLRGTLALKVGLRMIKEYREGLFVRNFFDRLLLNKKTYFLNVFKTSSYLYKIQKNQVKNQYVIFGGWKLKLRNKYRILENKLFNVKKKSKITAIKKFNNFIIKTLNDSNSSFKSSDSVVTKEFNNNKINVKKKININNKIFNINYLTEDGLKFNNLKVFKLKKKIKKLIYENNEFLNFLKVNGVFFNLTIKEQKFVLKKSFFVLLSFKKQFKLLLKNFKNLMEKRNELLRNKVLLDCSYLYYEKIKNFQKLRFFSEINNNIDLIFTNELDDESKPVKAMVEDLTLLVNFLKSNIKHF